ncbi:MAG: hypothetical protein ACLQUY_27350 [Ktedonobacterales bacterium]
MASQEKSNHSGLWSKRPLQASVAVILALAVIAGLLVLRARLDGAVASLGGPSASVAAGGLQMTIAVPPGPYFLSELLEVQMTLANQSQTTYQVQGDPRPSYCDSAIWVGQSGGEPPTYQWPTFPDLRCAELPSTLAPGEQWSILQFIPLTPSGRVTLSAQATFYTIVSTEPDGGTEENGGPGPFTNGWPSLTIQVAPTVPANRTIALAAENGRLSISPPPGARAHLYYLYIVTCAEGGGTGEGQTNGYWQPVSSTPLAEPSCQGTHERWQYSVAAPGYAIASGMLGGQ